MMHCVKSRDWHKQHNVQNWVVILTSHVMEELI